MGVKEGRTEEARDSQSNRADGGREGEREELTKEGRKNKSE